MLPIFLLCLLGSVLSVPLSPTNVVTSIPEEEYILPGTTIPTLYDLTLFLDPRNTVTFKGNVLIRFRPNEITSEIVLHAMSMTIENVQLWNVTHPNEGLLESYTLATDDTHFLKIASNTPLKVNEEYTLRIDYIGTFATNMFGLYVSTYQHETEGLVNLIASQLQPTFARRVFPCFDEPRYKAVFRTTIYAPPQYTVVRTNMPETTTTASKPAVEGFSKYEYQDTPIMSTYLLAFLVSNFEYVSNAADMKYKIPFRIYARPGSKESSKFALDFGQDNMIKLENYYDLPYDLPKLDKAAIPDFAAGAMENWGLVLYREVALLVTEGVTTTSTLQNIGRIISHENVHMWIGNEVSPVNWTYTWLNEGFANFFENYATDLVLPEWRMMDQFNLAVQSVFQNDAVLTVNPMTHPVYTPSQIISTFNTVAYQKSGSVIRMLQHFLTPDVFRQGLVTYIQNNARKAVRPKDLYESLQAAANEKGIILPDPIAEIMHEWTTQGGFPVLTVKRQAPTAQSISVRQERFLTDPSLTSTTKWYVPINWVLSTNPDFTNTSTGDWIKPSTVAQAVDIPGLSEASWFILNKQQTGYYRVNYEDDNWLALANALMQPQTPIHVLNRAQLVDDVFNLARNGRTDYVNAFELSRYLINETDYIPWGSANAAFNYIDIVLTGTPIYEQFQTYILELTEPLYNRLGFEAQPNEEHVTPFHRTIILSFNCRFGNEKCVNKSRELLQQYQADPSQRINPDIQTTVFCSALRDGNADTFNFLWQQFRTSQDSSEQAILLSALGCTSNATLRTFYMNQVIASDSEVREQDRHSILVSIINSSPAGMEAALDFVVENFAAIQPRVQGLTGTSNILIAFSRRLTSKQHSTKIDTFISRHESLFTAAELAGVDSIKESIASSISWSENNYNKVNDWLRKRYGNNASMITSSFLIVISIFVSIYNY